MTRARHWPVAWLARLPWSDGERAHRTLHVTPAVGTFDGYGRLEILDLFAVAGLEADAARCGESVEQNLALATALAPAIGYDRAARIAQTAYRSGKTIRQVAREENVMPEDELDDKPAKEAPKKPRDELRIGKTYFSKSAWEKYVEAVEVRRDDEVLAVVQGVSYAERAETRNLARLFRRTGVEALHVGVLHAKDLLRAMYAKRSEAASDAEAWEDFDFLSVAMKPYFVPETTTLDDGTVVVAS